MSRLAVTIVGRGRVGAALARGLRRAGARVVTLSGRALLEGRVPPAMKGGVAVLAVRDAELARAATVLGGLASAPRAVLHVAGAAGPEALAELRSRGVAVAQMHPLLSFVNGLTPSFAGATLFIAGDPVAATIARRIARLLGMRPRVIAALDPATYHAAAALVANGAVALVVAAAELLRSRGVDGRVASAMLGPLLGSVASNVSAVGLPQALTGPVRRGDTQTISKHLAAIRSALGAGSSLAHPQMIEKKPVLKLYLTVCDVQLAMAHRLGEATPDDLATIGRLIDEARSK